MTYTFTVAKGSQERGESMDETRAADVWWTGRGLVFEAKGTEPATPSLVVDGDGSEGVSPMQQLLIAAGACAAIDIVVILEKMRAEPTVVRVAVSGERAPEHPKRFLSMQLHFEVGGGKVDLSKVDRAVELSMKKYCSVMNTLDSSVELTYDTALV